MTDPLALPGRTGLSDDIAYLRRQHPQPSWRAHRNFGELANFWLHIHATLRSEAGAIDTLTSDLRAGRSDIADTAPHLIPAFNGFLQHLDAHHRIEDGAYFPKFRALDPRMDRGFALLEADHVLIDRTLHDAIASARAMLAAPGDVRATEAFATTFADLGHLLDRHLADEEDLVIPALLEHGERSIGH